MGVLAILVEFTDQESIWTRQLSVKRPRGWQVDLKQEALQCPVSPLASVVLPDRESGEGADSIYVFLPGRYILYFGEIEVAVFVVGDVDLPKGRWDIREDVGPVKWALRALPGGEIGVKEIGCTDLLHPVLANR